jgi:hypothetical protein
MTDRPTRKLWPVAVALTLAAGCNDAALRVPTFDAGPDDGGVDGGPGCPAGRRFCEGLTLYECDADGQARTRIEECDAVCDGELGCVACLPGAGRCDDTVSTRCAGDGSSYQRVRDCAASGVACLGNGYCDDACGDAERGDSNLGCSFLAVPMLTDFAVSRTTATYQIAVANPGPGTASLEIRRGRSFLRTGRIEAGEVELFSLPWIPEMSFREADFFRVWVNSFQTVEGAYRIRTDRPVAMVQFAPYETGAPFLRGSDASLLVPTHVLGGETVGLTAFPYSGRQGSRTGKAPAYLAVAASADTTVTVAPRVDFTAADDGSWGAAAAGEPWSFDLQEGDVVHLVPAPPPDCTPDRPGYQRIADGRSIFYCLEVGYDPSRTRVTATAPVAVFGGSVYAGTPHGYAGGGRIEAQLPPRHTWGTEHVAVPVSHVANPSPLERVGYLRVVTGTPDTEVRIEPPPEGFEPRRIGPDDVLELEITEPCRVTGSQPILVGFFIPSTDRYWVTDPPDRIAGAPSFTTLPPVEQYRSDYVFVSPESYDRGGPEGQNYVVLVRPTGLAITLDDEEVEADWSPVGAYETAIVQVSGGVHRARADGPFGLLAYGMALNASYLYPGGTDLRRIPLR